MKDTLIKVLLKSKSDEASKIEDLIEKYLSGVHKQVHTQTKEFVSELIVYILKNLEEISKDEILQVVNSKIEHWGIESVPTASLEEIYNKSAILASGSVGASFSFDRVDAQVMESMYRALTWMKDDGTAKTQEKLKNTIAKAMNGEINITELGKVLRDELGGVVDGTSGYFQAVSEHTIRQAQSLSRAYQFQKADVEYVKIVAQIDSRTSAICRSLNGRIVPLSHLLSQADAISSAVSVEEKKKASPWQSQPIFGKLPQDVGLPPYHFRCRSIVVAFYPQVSEVDGKKVRGSYPPGDKYKGKEVLFSHVDSAGYERIVTYETINHKSNSIKPPLSKIKSAMENVTDISIHIDDNTGEERIQTYSKIDGQKVGMYISYYPDGEMVTAFYRDRAYFKTRIDSGHIVLRKSMEEKDE